MDVCANSLGRKNLWDEEVNFVENVDESGVYLCVCLFMYVCVCVCSGSGGSVT